MRWLPEQQRAFGDALVGGVTPHLTRFFADDAEKLERRFAAYRRNFWANHRNPLAATYRVVEMLVGPAIFHELATAFVTAHPSADADLNRYGREFAGCLADQQPTRRYPYLPDVARVEWALLEAYGAADAPSFDFAALAALPVSRQGDVRLIAAPGSTLIASDYPLAAIWSAHQHEDGPRRDDALAQIDLTPRPSWTLVFRDRVDQVRPHALTSGAATFCAACLDAQPLGDALAAAVVVEPDADVGSWVVDWVSRGWIVGFRDD